MAEMTRYETICRIVTKEEQAHVMKLWETCFDDTVQFVSWYFARYWNADYTLGIYEQQETKEQLQASAQVIPYTLSVRDTTIPCGYVVGVNTAPEARNKGYAKQLLKECLHMQRMNRQPISLLMPFEGQFYYRYGWPFCYFHQRIVTEPNQLRCIAKQWGTVHKVDLFGAQKEMEQVYSQFTKNYHGTIKRNTEQWKLQLEDAKLEQTDCFLIEDEQQTVQGYFLQTRLDGKCFVREMAWCHESAKNGMLHYLMQTVTDGMKLWLELPEEDDLKYHLAASKTDIVLYPFLMARIVDVKQCLETIHYPVQHAKLLLNISDDFAEWNTGRYVIEIQNGRGSVLNLDEITYEQLQSSGILAASLSIDALSQMVMGTKNAESLFYSENIICPKTHQQAMICLLNQLWPKQQNYINEYY